MKDTLNIDILRIDKITRSHIFRDADALCKLLYFLAEKANADPEYSAKEYEIATVVFKRRADFDPRTDSSARVQIARLRSKLIEYYTSEGIDDEVHIEIPKGAYRLQYVVNPKAPLKPLDADHGVEGRTEATTPSPTDSLATENDGHVPLTSHPVKPRSASWQFLVIALVALFLGALIGRISTHPAASDAKPGTLGRDSVLQTFWHAFTVGSEQTWLIFSNARFVGNAVGGLRYFDPVRDRSQNPHAFYTGVGEVIGVHQFDNLFRSFGSSILVKRAAQLSLEDVKDTNLIFLGAPTENSSLANLAALRSFRFQEISSGEREGQVEILNKEPGPGEQPRYMIANLPTQPLVDDYAVIAMLPGMTSSHRIFIAAGTTTIGTQAAVEYVCSPDGVANLMKQLGSSAANQDFEVLLHVTIVNDVPLVTKVVTVHRPH